MDKAGHQISIMHNTDNKHYIAHIFRFQIQKIEKIQLWKIDHHICHLCNFG